MEVNKYNGIIYRPYNHAATHLIIEFQTTRWISCSAHKISNNKVQSFLYTFQTMLKSYNTTNKNPLKHRVLSLLSLLGAEMVVWRPCTEYILRCKINKDIKKRSHLRWDVSDASRVLLSSSGVNMAAAAICHGTWGL